MNPLNENYYKVNIDGAVMYGCLKKELHTFYTF